MSAKQQRQPSILEVAVSNIGIRRGGRAAADLVFWALAMTRAEWAEAETIEDKVEIFSEVAIMSRRAAWRRLQAFREAFPDEADPFRLAGLLLEQLGPDGLQAPKVILTLYPAP